jgi:hypothetical protein
MRTRILLIIFILVTVHSASLRAQLSGLPGAFARLGFGARGMGMGNAMTAMRDGELTGFYNPAATPFLSGRVVAASYGLLSLDRSLNTLSYSQAVHPSAGFSVGIINAGVRKIDGRDADGFQTEEYFTSENQFSFSFADKVSQYVSLGVGLKIYYYRLFAKVSSTNLGVDIGTLVRLTERLTLGIAVQDINSKYKWDTSNLYGEQGNSTTEKFPLLRKIGASYSLSDYGGIISLELENNNSNTNIIRLGGEIDLSDEISLRAGIDHWDVKRPEQASPTFGFSIRTSIDDFTPALNYAYVVEPYGLFAMHIISLSTRF